VSIQAYRHIDSDGCSNALRRRSQMSNLAPLYELVDEVKKFPPYVGGCQNAVNLMSPTKIQLGI
jgi:hypothetical protein